MSRMIFVTGTDTGVGKTLVAGGLTRAFLGRGLSACALKPFSSGTPEGEDPEDALFLQAASGGRELVEWIAPERFAPPLSPLAAAREEGREVDLSRADEVLDQALARYDVVVVEGIGGIMVPLTADTLLLDFMASRKPTTVVAARPGLGTLNHTLLTVRALKEAGFLVAAVLLSHTTSRESDPSEGSNRGLLADLLGLPILDLPFLGETFSPKTLPREPFATLAEDLVQ